MNKPSTPTATAAFDNGATNSLCPPLDEPHTSWLLYRMGCVKNYWTSKILVGADS